MWSETFCDFFCYRECVALSKTNTNSIKTRYSRVLYVAFESALEETLQGRFQKQDRVLLIRWIIMLRCKLFRDHDKGARILAIAIVMAVNTSAPFCDVRMCIPLVYMITWPSMLTGWVRVSDRIRWSDTILPSTDHRWTFSQEHADNDCTRRSCCQLLQQIVTKTRHLIGWCHSSSNSCGAFGHFDHQRQL